MLGSASAAFGARVPQAPNACAYHMGACATAPAIGAGVPRALDGGRCAADPGRAIAGHRPRSCRNPVPLGAVLVIVDRYLAVDEVAVHDRAHAGLLAGRWRRGGRRQ